MIRNVNPLLFSYSHCNSAFKACLCRTWNYDFFSGLLVFMCFSNVQLYIYFFFKKVFSRFSSILYFLMKKKQTSAEILFSFQIKTGKSRQKEHISKRLWLKIFLKANVLNNVHTTCVTTKQDFFSVCGLLLFCLQELSLKQGD